MCVPNCSPHLVADEVLIMSELWQTMNPMEKFGQFVFFKAYMDDSEHNGIFTLCALLGAGLTWDWVNGDWSDMLTHKNRELAKQGRKPISCYHATDCSNLYREFNDW